MGSNGIDNTIFMYISLRLVNYTNSQVPTS